MFRVSERGTPERLVLKLEGRCSSDVVGELEAGWRAAVLRAGGGPVVVDLSDVWLVDDAARAQLARMRREGARFVTRGCLMRELIREITGEATEFPDHPAADDGGGGRVKSGGRQV